jgi:hypothetical protein
MRSLAWLACAAAATMLLARSVNAELLLSDIRSPKHCPEGLAIKSKVVSDGLIQFDISLDAEDVAHAGELYKGRVSAYAVLQIGSDEQRVATITPQATKEGKLTRYQFRLSPAMAKVSELQLGVSLFEKDGFKTLGGGHTLRIYLAGFEPDRDASK